MKKETSFDKWQFAKKDDLANLKLEVDKLYIDELKNIPCSLNSLNSKVDNLDFTKLKEVLVDIKKVSE